MQIDNEEAKAQTDRSEKHGSIDSFFVHTGMLAAEIVSNGAARIYGAAVKAFLPLHKKLFRKSADKRKTSDFILLRKENGFVKAAGISVKNKFTSVKNSGKLFGTIVNYTAPALSIALLVTAVSVTASRNYGISVEYNGKEIGVVSAESVLAGAQEKIADKPQYSDTENSLYITANLSIKPLNALDEVMDEVALADKLEEEIPAEAAYDAAPAEEPAEQPAESSEDAAAEEIVEEIDGKIRAYAVTVDGEMIGAVESTNEISSYIESVKSEYMGADVVSVDFDKAIEFGYEQYVYPDEIVSEQSIIDTFNSIVAEPSYYTVQPNDSPWAIADVNGMTVDEVMQCPASYEGTPIDDLSVFCPVGAKVQLSSEVPYLQIVETKKISYTDIVDYDIDYIEDDSLYKGTKVVDTDGVEGEAEYEALVTYQAGIQLSRQVTTERITKQPVTKVVRVGTMETTTPVSTGSGGSGEYFWPVDGGYISAYMGDGRGHKGIDIAAPYGTKIYAAASGYVSRTGNKGDGYGICIFITQDDGNIGVYAHQSSSAVNDGDYVVAGQLIGYVGATGDATGNHLHFEVRNNGRYIDPLDYVSQY